MKDFQGFQPLVWKQDLREGSSVAYPSWRSDLLHYCFQSLVNNLKMCIVVSQLFIQMGGISLRKGTDVLKQQLHIRLLVAFSETSFANGSSTFLLTVSTILWAQIRSYLWKNQHCSWTIPSILPSSTHPWYYCGFILLIICAYCLFFPGIWEMLCFVCLRQGLRKYRSCFALVYSALRYFAIIL